MLNDRESGCIKGEYQGFGKTNTFPNCSISTQKHAEEKVFLTVKTIANVFNQ